MKKKRIPAIVLPLCRLRKQDWDLLTALTILSLLPSWTPCWIILLSCVMKIELALNLFLFPRELFCVNQKNSPIDFFYSDLLPSPNKVNIFPQCPLVLCSAGRPEPRVMRPLCWTRAPRPRAARACVWCCGRASCATASPTSSACTSPTMTWTTSAWHTLSCAPTCLRQAGSAHSGPMDPGLMCAPCWTRCTSTAQVREEPAADQGSANRPFLGPIQILLYNALGWLMADIWPIFYASHLAIAKKQKT